MSNLNDSLKKIKITAYFKKGEEYLFLNDKDITEIKQAFAEAGYINMQGAKVSGPKYTVQTYRGDGARMMTGQEWYERFDKELRAEDTYSIDEILQAAKRASGIDHDKE